MASLQKLVSYHKDDINDGMAWLVFYKNGRSWNTFYFYEISGDYDNGYVLSKNDLTELNRIKNIDSKAICINGYYMGFGDDLAIDDIMNKIIYFYDNRRNQLESDFLDYMIVK